MNGPPIMSPQHPRWPELLARLDEVERCQRTTAHTRAILEGMGGIDVAASMRALRSLGGDCDCAIRFDLNRGSSCVLI